MNRRDIKYYSITIVAFFLFVATWFNSEAQIKNSKDINPPEFHCVSIMDANSIQLSWGLPENVNNNYSYLLYVSYNLNGPYTKVDSIPYFQTRSYLHTGVSPYNSQYFYYMKSCSLATKGKNIYSVTSDTLKTMFLDMTDKYGIDTLSWNSLSNKIINGSNDWYYIYREYPIGNWVVRDSISLNSPLLLYLDTIDICGDSLNYKIELQNSFGCSSFSNIRGKYLADQTNPHKPIIDYVTVDVNSGHNLIKWQPDQSTDTKGYIIYKNLNSVGTEIGSIIGRDSTSFIHWESNPSLDKETYNIIAFDSCNHQSAASNDHNSIFLSIAPNRCEYSIELSWNPYINMESGLKSYIIYKKTGFGQFIPFDTLSPDSTKFYDYNIIADYTYTYYVKAIDNTGTRVSNSNWQSLTFSYPRKPNFNYLRKVTVKGDNKIEVYAYIDTTAYISEYHLYRIENNGKDTTMIQNLFHLTGTNVSFVDKSVSTNQKSYQYIIKLKDVCGDDELLTSNLSSSIFLKATMQSGMRNLLTWNKYQTWDGEVNHYNVYRKTENGWDIFPIATLISDDSDTINHIDDVSSLVDSDGQFSYYVEAIEGTGNTYGFTDTSSSNITSVNQYPKLFVPNAFAPEGYNKIFLPIMGFIRPNDYLLQIYDRWGALVFETKDKYVGWDGQYKNSDAPKGVYVYLIKLKNANNEIIEKHGTVTLIR
ncbi:MAG: hypothetical protein AUJ97_06335 [Bacteroidetes bacterium CG2_30_32_10]|nr:MAG: hypothetical protein AUJ97_06335 [Bacteroidetes bacterium CG2_30_32_10]